MTDKTLIELAILLPDILDARDQCYERLVDSVQARAGVDAVHLLERGTDAPGTVCIHYDPDRISLQDVRALAERSGAQLSERYGHLLAEVEPMRPRQARRLSEKLERNSGLLEAQVSPDGTVRIEFDRDILDEAQARELFRTQTGKRAAIDETHVHAPAHGHRTELVFVALCGVTLLAGWLLDTFSGAPAWMAQSLFVAAYLFGGWFTFIEAIANLRLRRFEIDTLMLVAAIGAAALGEWAEGALLLFLFSLGHSLEAYAMGRAKRAIEALGDLAPKTASVLKDGNVDEVPVEDLVVGDIVLVRPNERLPADGFVIKGESTVNQAPITGESVPVDKQPVADVEFARANIEAIDAPNRVFAGSINGTGALQVFVTRLSGESTLARVVELVREAETNQSPTQ